MVKRLRRGASAETVVAAIKKAFQDGYYEVEDFRDDDRYGMRWVLRRSDITEFLQTEATLEDFAAAGDTLSRLDPDQLPTLVDTSKKNVIRDICLTYEIGASDKDFSGGVEVVGEELHVDMYLMGSAQYVD